MAENFYDIVHSVNLLRSFCLLSNILMPFNLRSRQIFLQNVDEKRQEKHFANRKYVKRKFILFHVEFMLITLSRLHV